MRSYKCPVCGRTCSNDLSKYIQHTETHIVDLIKQKHPEWAENSGICPKCLEYYRQQMKGDKA